jgi:hypothetical protein
LITSEEGFSRIRSLLYNGDTEMATRAFRLKINDYNCRYSKKVCPLSREELANKFLPPDKKDKSESAEIVRFKRWRQMLTILSR